MPYSRSAVAGVYRLTFDTRKSECLTLRADSTFTQTFESQTHSGRWEYVKSPGASHVLLHRQRIFVGTPAVPAGEVHGDLTVERSSHGPELVYDVNEGLAYEREE